MNVRKGIGGPVSGLRDEQRYNRDISNGPFRSRHPKRARRPGISNLVLVLVLLAGMALGACSNEPDPVPLDSIPAGTWIDTTKIAEADGKAHQVQYIVDKFIRDPEEVAAAIEAYNLSAAGQVINPLESSNLEFCLMEYRVKFPKTFPQKRFGITDVTIPFKIISLYGGEIQVDGIAYPNLGGTVEIGELPQGYDFHRGDTYHGVIVFAMVKGFDGYLVQEVKGEDDGEAPAVLIRGE